ncbi:hypothetical protein A966_03478, partial [Brachyspira hampsonii 30446]
MEKEFASIFESNKEISLDEYEINKLLDKTIEINENEFPVISIGNSDKESPKILATITTKKYEEKENSEDTNLEYSDEITSNAYSDEETKKYKNLQETLSLSENDIEVAGEIVDSEIDMSSLFPNSDNSPKTEEELEKNKSELTEEQSEIINNIYSEEENDIHKESEEESLEGYELSNIETVEDFSLDESFKKADVSEYSDEDLLYNQLEDDAEDSSNSNNIEDENFNAEELNSLDNTIKELKIDNEEDVDIEDLIGTDNFSNLEEDIKDESIRLGETDLNNLEDTIKDLLNNKNDSSKDLNIEDLISFEHQENSDTKEEEPTSSEEESHLPEAEESQLEMKEYTDEELLDAGNILEDEPLGNEVTEESEKNIESESSLEESASTEESIDEDTSEEESIPSEEESELEMKEYTDEELLDTDNILEDEPSGNKVAEEAEKDIESQSSL